MRAAKAEGKQPDGAPVTIDGITFVGRRVTMTPYLVTGRVPQRLANQLAAATQEEGADGAEQTPMTGADLIELGQFARLVITDAVIEPRIVYEQRALQVGEVSAYELPTGWLDKVYEWALRGTGADGEEASAPTLANFPDDATGPGQSVDPSAHGANVQPKAKRAARAKRSS